MQPIPLLTIGLNDMAKKTGFVLTRHLQTAAKLSALMETGISADDIREALRLVEMFCVDRSEDDELSIAFSSLEGGAA